MKKTVANKPQNYVTEHVFEKRMIAIGKSFAGVDERLDRHEKVFKGILSTMGQIQETNKEIKQNIQDFLHHTSIQERRIDNLTERVEKLERRTVKAA